MRFKWANECKTESLTPNIAVSIIANILMINNNKASLAFFSSSVSCDEILDNKEEESLSRFGENLHKNTTHSCDLEPQHLVPWAVSLDCYSVHRKLLPMVTGLLYLHSASWDAPSVRMGFGIPWVDLLLLLLAEANRTQIHKHIGEHKDYIVGEKELGSLAWNSHLTTN